MDELMARARAYYRGNWRDLTIQPRWHSLVVGPTGSGKSAIASIAARKMSCPTIPVKLVMVSAPGWMPCGAHQRGARETLSYLAEAVASNPNTLLVIDEIDKIYQTDSSWMGHIRGEIYQICDGRWPTGLQMPDDDSTAIPIAALEAKLRNTVFIVGIGTFQDFFDSSASRRAIGFGADTNSATDQLTAEIVAQKLPRELANRFNSRLIRIPELQAEDYHRISLEAEYKLPTRMQAAFRLEVSRRIDDAITTKKGVRFLEECAMETLKNLPEFELDPGIPNLMNNL